MIGQRSYAGTGDAIQYNKRFFHLSSMAPRAQTMPNRKLRPKPQWALEDSIRHSPGFGIVPQGVRGNMFLDARTAGGFLACFPRRFGRDRHIAAPALYSPGEEIGFGLHPAPVDPQGLQQFLAQRDISVVPAFALSNVDDHTAAINVSDLQE